MERQYNGEKLSETPGKTALTNEWVKYSRWQVMSDPGQVDTGRGVITQLIQLTDSFPRQVDL